VGGRSQVGVPKFLFKDLSPSKVRDKLPAELAGHLRNTDSVKRRIMDDANHGGGGDEGVVPKLAGYRKRVLRDFTHKLFASSTLDSGSMSHFLQAKSWEERQKEASFTVWACARFSFICSRLFLFDRSRVGTDVNQVVGCWFQWWIPRSQSS